MNECGNVLSTASRLAAAIGLCGAASAAMAGFSDPLVTFAASNSLGSGTFDVTLGDATGLDYNGDSVADAYQWTLGGGVDITDGGNVIGRIQTGSLLIGTSPGFNQQMIVMAFNVMAADGADTNFTISSSLLSFPAISDALARATAAFTLTDGNLNGATLTGLQPGGDLYEADYNGGNTFATLLSGPFSVGSGGSTSGSDDFPASGFSALGTSVTSMSSEWSFTLSAGDLASGTSNFVIIPAPGALGLAGVGLIVARRRR